MVKNQLVAKYVKELEFKNIELSALEAIVKKQQVTVDEYRLHNKTMTFLLNTPRVHQKFID